MHRKGGVEAKASQALKSVELGLAGAAGSFAVCWPFDFLFDKGQPIWALQIVGLAVLLRIVGCETSAKGAFVAGIQYASVWMAATFWWMYVAMHTYGGLPGAMAIAAVIVLALGLSLYYSCAIAAYWKLGRARPASTAMTFAALWSLAELARGTCLSGFGWGAMAYAHTQGPLSIWAPVVGAYGIGALAAWMSASLAQFRSIGWLQRGACIALMCIGWMFQAPNFTTANGHLNVTLLQGNIPQDEKFDTGTGVPLALQWYAQQMNLSAADLVIAPETAIPMLPQQLPEGYWAGLRQSIIGGHAAVLTGMPLGSYEKGYTNSVVAIPPTDGPIWRYDKHHLVPFGEYIPPLFKWFTRMMNIPLGDFNRGALGQPSFAWKGERIAPNICYEDLFSEEIGVRFIDPESAPTIFANVSNLGWFGDTTAIDQHLQISRMRALEFQRPFVRATNTGMTVIMDHRGQVTESLPRATQGVLKGVVEGRKGITPYAWWVSRFGLWPLWFAAFAVVLRAWRTRTKS